MQIRLLTVLKNLKRSKNEIKTEKCENSLRQNLGIFAPKVLFLSYTTMNTFGKLPHGLEPESRNSVLEERLDKLAKETDFYLQLDINMDEVALRLATNRTYLSRMINQKKGCSFSDYINELRLEKAYSLFSTPGYMRSHSIGDLAEGSGFASVATFRRAFVKKYDETPLFYINKYGFKK